MKKLASLSLAVAMAVILAACASQPQFIPANYAAADALLEQLGDKLSPSQPLIVATIVNIDALERSSTLGRLVSEQVSARFSQAGLKMVEMKFRNNVYMKQDEGELLLTRELRDVAQSHNAQAVIVGTYGISDEAVFVNLKVIQPNTNIVIAVHDYVLPKDTEIRSMLR
jgi:TolB-like protein